MLACISFLEFNLKVVFNVYKKGPTFFWGVTYGLSNRTVKTFHFVEFGYNEGQENIFFQKSLVSLSIC